MIRVGIIGSTGQVGEGLIKILVGHPQAELAFLASEHAAGQDIADVLPALRGSISQKTRPPDIDAMTRDCDVVFMAKKTPDSMQIAPRLLDAGVKAIDIGGEFRLKDAALYKRYYGEDHTCPELLAEAVYGLTELHREQLRTARLIANPGCYPTSAILPLAPLLKAKLIEADGICVNSTSGLSGAGRTYSPKVDNLFVACDEDVRAYGFITHKHRPEIEQELSLAAGRKIAVVFQPHLVPLDRGMFTTIYATASATADRVLACWHDAYGREPFIRIFDKPGQVNLRQVAGTNYCDLSVASDPRTGRIILVSALDNTVKGAAGQAVQNMNAAFGIEETTALLRRGI
jgi:N-acetyl-gamma-glutamyl-phosphate reductase